MWTKADRFNIRMAGLGKLWKNCQSWKPTSGLRLESGISPYKV